mgnify:CR=1 FL=1|tara:strand:- start:1885 stop:2205 length:321 start_codon:yes stop_codon:yes gene_type:complete
MEQIIDKVYKDDRPMNIAMKAALSTISDYETVPIPELWNQLYDIVTYVQPVRIKQRQHIITDSVISCRKCKQKSIRTEQAQLRSGDESMSVFCVCTNPHCGDSWIM